MAQSTEIHGDSTQLSRSGFAYGTKTIAMPQPWSHTEPCYTIIYLTVLYTSTKQMLWLRYISGLEAACIQCYAK